MADDAIVTKLLDRITSDRVEEYFRQHSSDFDAAWVARLEMVDESQARELAEQVRTGLLDFFAAAERCFFESAERGMPSTAGLFSVGSRR